MVEYGNFRMSLKRLGEQYENYRELDAALPPLLREAVAESVIQRFEACYDCLWKVLKRYLVEELGVADSSQSRQVYDLKEALGESNLPFRVDVFLWDSMPEQFRERVRPNHVVLVAGEGAIS